MSDGTWIAKLVMSIRRVRIAVLSVIVSSLLVGFFVLNRPHGVKVSFSNGCQLLVRKTSYGQDHRFFVEPVRRAIASNALTEGLWRRLEENVPAFPRFLRISNLCCSHQSTTPALVVFGEISAEAGLPAWQFCPVASGGEEGAPLQIEGVSPPPLVGRFMFIMDLDKQPSKVRIYEVDSRMNTRRLLAEVPVSEGPN